jgi:UDP:flavonoid glycosyltransferase YjiC (YdhE family)
VVSDYPGHYFPMVPLGWALQAAGHEVRIVCGPGQVETASRTGLPALARGTDVDTLVQARIGYHLEARAGLANHPGLPPLHPLTGEPMARVEDFDWPAYQPQFVAQQAIQGRDRTRGIAGFARHWRPELVLYDLLSVEGLVAAHVSGARAVCHLWGPTGTDEAGYGLERMRPDIPAPVRERLGIDPDAELVTHVIDPCPPEVAPATRATRLPVRYVPYHGPGSAGRPAFAAPGRRRIVVVWSNSLTRIFGPASFVVPTVLAAAADLDVELVLALSADDAARLGTVPPGVQVLRQFPLSLLLHNASVVVHHGGAGCLMTALAAGVPQLALPFGLEQEMIARRLAGTGAGIAIQGSAAEAGNVGTALRALLDVAQHAHAARSLAARNAAAPSPAELVPVLAGLVDRSAHARAVRGL